MNQNNTPENGGLPNEPAPEFREKADDAPQPSPAEQPAPQPHRDSNVSGGEMFVGLNILSKIGVLFIIIGVIAFAAVSEEYMPGVARTILVFLLGIVMAAAGEVFYRKSSKVFARALTIGGIGELFICVPVAFFSFETINAVAALIIGAAAAAGGILLSYRYNSQTILGVTLGCSFLTYLPLGDNKVMFAFGMAYLLLMQVIAVIFAHKKDWKIIPFVGFVYGFACSIAVNLGLLDIHFEDSFTCILSSVFAIITFSIYVIYVTAQSFRRSGELGASGMVLLISSAFVSALMVLCFMTGDMGANAAGIVLLIMLALYSLVTIASVLYTGSFSALTISMQNILMSLAVPVIFTLLKGRYAFPLFHLYAGALMIIGIVNNRRLFKYWGYATLPFAELLFLFGCVPNSNESLFKWQFIINAAVWLAIMITAAAKGIRGAGFNFYSLAALINTGILGTYLVSLLGDTLERAEILKSVDLFSIMLSAAVWMLMGFAAGKLKFMEKGSAPSSLVLYSLGMIYLLCANIYHGFQGFDEIGWISVLVAVAINVVSVLAALDMALIVKSFAPKFARAVGLVVSAYALGTLTVVLDTNNVVGFTSCVISIIYIVMAAAWIFFGFRCKNALLRRFGLALALFSSAKLFLFDFSNINPMGRTLMFIGFGIALLCISFAYGYLEMRLKQEAEKEKNDAPLQ